MEKIKITVEQEKEFKEYIGLGYETSDFESYIHDYGHFNVLQKHFPNLSKVKPEEFALLLCGWYEVKKPFKVGDWVFDRELGDYSKIIEIHADKIIFQGEDEDYIENFGDYEVITESWKIMLLELGREKPEFVEDDIIIFEDGMGFFVGEFGNEDENLEKFNLKEMSKFYPVESIIEVNNND